MTGWAELQAALDGAAERGEAIRVWWRDDDAGRDHPALTRLLELAERHDLPLALAVVPLWLEANGHARIAASRHATVLQHGFAHANHAPPEGRSIELGGRDLAPILAELEKGRAMLADAFGCAFLAVLVPPWNRLDAGLVERLTGCGFIGLSTFGRRAEAEAAPGLVQVNTHLDPIDWRGTRLFVGEAAALARLVAVLDADEPIGIVSHHLAMDEAGWVFLDRLLGVLAAHPGARLCRGGRAVRAMTGPLLEIRDLAVDFLADEGVVQAVRGVSFNVEQGQTVALVGESGSGKTVISQAILGILPQIARITRGSIVFRDPRRNHAPLDLAAYDDSDPVRRSIRGGRISIIFQEPMSSLSPLHTIGDQISEALLLHSRVDRWRGRAADHRDAGPGRLPRSGARLQDLSVRVVGRPAPAGDDRDGAGVRSGAADRRRADHRAGRHHPGADPAADEGAPAASSRWRSCSSRTISASSPTWPTRWSCCTTAG